jgi:hypothetical protein
MGLVILEGPLGQVGPTQLVAINGEAEVGGGGGEGIMGPKKVGIRSTIGLSLDEEDVRII